MSEANPKKRLFAVLLLVLAGSGFLAYGSAQFLGNNKGWDIIQVGSTEQLHCGEDFMISYCLGQGEASASAEKRALSILYTDAAQKAYAMFDTDADSEGYANLYHINTHPNEILEVDEGLYDVFRKVEQYDSRFLYLAPVYEYYENLFYNRDETAYLLYTGEGN